LLIRPAATPGFRIFRYPTGCLSRREEGSGRYRLRRPHREYFPTAIGARSAQDPSRAEGRARLVVPGLKLAVASVLANGHGCRRLRESVGRHTPQHCSGLSRGFTAQWAQGNSCAPHKGLEAQEHAMHALAHYSLLLVGCSTACGGSSIEKPSSVDALVDIWPLEWVRRRWANSRARRRMAVRCRHGSKLFHRNASIHHDRFSATVGENDLPPEE